MDNTIPSNEQEVDSGVESTNSSDSAVYLRISVPELNVQKCLQFHQDDTVWTAKRQILSSIAKTLKDGFNYGLFCPPVQGKSGKFLEEERPLKDYPLPGPIGYLEFKYKRRVYRQVQTNPRKLKQIHAKTNLKQMMEAVKKNDVNRVTKFTNGGLDPNFSDTDTGETPLTLATLTPNPVETVMALVSGGAHLDFRNRKSLTPLHTAAHRGNDEAIRVLLDLGASANYRDCHGLTPLYHAVCQNVNARCVEILLYDHALLGIVDEYGSTELHQASKSGNVHHLEQLIYYGADMNSQNSSGNTPLHVCAINQKEECVRVLLFRGANKDIQNYANQNASELAVISGNTHLANDIQEFSPDDVVPYQDLPTFSVKRRSCIPASTLSTLKRCRSNPQLHHLFENFSSDGSQRHVADDSVLAKRGDRRVNRRMTELALVTEFTVDGLFGSRSPRSLSISSSGSGQTGDIDLASSPSSTSLQKTKLLNEGLIEKTVILEEGETGFGFILRGAKAPESGVVHLDFVPTPKLPALQYFERVEPNSPADGAGIKPGDFLLSVNGFDVRAASHDYTVKLIKESDCLLTLTVLVQKLPNMSFSTLTGVGPQRNLDCFLKECDSPDRSRLCGESCNESMAFTGVAGDLSSQIASIKSIHGKRLAPSISELVPRAERNATDRGGMWKAKSVHCLASASGCMSVLDKPDKRGVRNQPQSGIGTSQLSLARESDNMSGSHSCTRPEFVDNAMENRCDGMTAENIRSRSSAMTSTKRPAPPPPPFPPVVKTIDTQATVEICSNSSDVNFHAIKHSLPDNHRVVSGSQTKREIYQKSPPASSATERSCHIETNGDNWKKKAKGEFKVSPPLPPPPPPPQVPLKSAQRAGIETQGGNTRPAVPRRRSQLTDSSVGQKLFNEITAEMHSTVKTFKRESPAIDGGKASGDASNSSDFLTLAEAARLKFLNRNSGDLVNGVPGKTSDSVTSVNSNDQENHSKLVLNKIESVANDATRLDKFNREVNSRKELSLQEELKYSLIERRQLKSRHQTITGGVDSFLPEHQTSIHENRKDKMLNERTSHDLKSNTIISNSCITDGISLDLLKKETDASKEANIFTDLSSLVILPPQSFISGDNSDKTNSHAVVGQTHSQTPVCFDRFDFSSFVPPPPPGFEDPPIAPGSSLYATKKQAIGYQHQNDSAFGISHPLENWSIDEVSLWLESIHMGEHALNFRQNQIDGSCLALLGRSELISLGVTQVGQRMKIERAVKKAMMVNQSTV